MEYVTLQGLAERLGLARTAVSRLVTAGVVRDVQGLGPRTKIVSVEEADRLEAVPFVKRIPVPTLQTKIAGETSWSEDDAIRQWWPVAEPDILKGGLLATTVAGFVVRVDEILDYETQYGRRSFTLGKVNEDVASHIRGHRFKAVGGALTKLWTPQ